MGLIKIMKGAATAVGNAARSAAGAVGNVTAELKNRKLSRQDGTVLIAAE